MKGAVIDLQATNSCTATLPFAPSAMLYVVVYYVELYDIIVSREVYQCSTCRLVDVECRWGDNRSGRPPAEFWNAFSCGTQPRNDSQWEQHIRYVYALIVYHCLDLQSSVKN